MSKHTSLFGAIKHGLSLWKLYSKAVDKYHDKGGKAMLDVIWERLGEASTWRGIFAFLTAVGVAIRPELMEAIIVVGMGIVGLIGVLTKDKGD